MNGEDVPLLRWSGTARYGSLSRLATSPRVGLSKDSDYPEDKKHGEWNSQQPENECFSHDGLPFSSDG